MIFPSDKIRAKILKKYDSNPKDWKVLFGKDRFGYYNMAVLHDSELWLMKEERINPFKFAGFGAKLDLDTDFFKRISPYTFGLRPISEKQIKELIHTPPTNENIRKVFSNILKTKPIPSTKVDSPVVLQGPIVSSDDSMRLISDKHKELDTRLRNALRKMLYKKYPQTMNPYS